MTLQTYLTRLIWWCVTPLLVLAVALGYLQFRQVRDDDAVEARRLARIVAVEVDQTLKARIAGLQILSLSPLLDDQSRWSEFHRETQGFRAGFGGSVWALTRDAEAEAFEARWKAAYLAATPSIPDVASFLARPGPGMTEIDLSGL